MSTETGSVNLPDLEDEDEDEKGGEEAGGKSALPKLSEDDATQVSLRVRLECTYKCGGEYAHTPTRLLSA